MSLMEGVMRRLGIPALVVLAASITGTPGDEGRVPISQPTTITKSGSYLLTRDISVASGNLITIQASDVTLDLNGKALQIVATSDVLIALGSGASRLRVKNGRLIGGASGVATIAGAGPISLEASGLVLLNQSSDAIGTSLAGDVSVTDCVFRRTGNSGVAVSALPSDPDSAVRVADNVFSDIQNRSIIVSNARTVAILHNVSSETVNGIQISYNGFAAPGGSDIVQGNTLEERTAVATPGDGIDIFFVSGSRRTALVLDNVVSGFTRGMLLAGDGFRVAGNLVHRGATTGGATGDGVVLSSNSQSLIEDNQIQGNAGCGIVLNSTTLGNAYRNNMLRGNTGGAVCNTGSGNTDAGGNIL